MAGLPITPTTLEQQQNAANIAGSVATPSTTSTSPTALPKTNSYGNDMTLANQMNAQAAKMREVNNPTSALPTPGSSANVPSAPSYNPFSRPTDGAGDAAGRASQYDNLMREAANGSGLTKAQREAKIQAAQGMMMPGLSQMKQQGDDYAQQMNALNAGSLPAMFGGQNSGISPDVLKGLFSMFQTNQKPGETPAVPAQPVVPEKQPNSLIG